MDVTAREATYISNEYSEILALKTFPDVLVDGGKVLDCPQHSLRLVESPDKTGVDLKDDEHACLVYTASHLPVSPNRQLPVVLVSLGGDPRGMRTHSPTSQGVQHALLLRREHTQVIM